MTDEEFDADGSGGDGSSRDSRRGAFGLVRRALADLRRTPKLVVPFVLAGLVLAALDAVRLADPVPAQTETAARYGFSHLTILSHPGYARFVTRPVGALVGLRLPFLVEVVSVGVASSTTTAIAIAVVVAWADGEAVSLRRVPALVAYETLLLGAFGAFGAVVSTLGGFVEIAGLVVAAVVVATLFAAPVVVVRGATLRTALRESSVRTRGRLSSVVVLSVLLGTVQFWLVSVPGLVTSPFPAPVALAAGTTLAVAVVGPLSTLAAVHLCAPRGASADARLS